MKKLILSLFSVVLVSTLMIAQDLSPDKALKKATRNISTYNLNPSENADKLTEAKNLISGVVESGEFEKSSKAWLTYGKVYNEIASSEVQQLVLDPNMALSEENPSLKAYQGFSNALKYAAKGYEKKDAVKGIQGVTSNLNYLASILFKQQNFEEAYKSFDAFLEADEVLQENGEASIFSDAKDRSNQLYYAGLAAMNGGMSDEAIKQFEAIKAGDDAEAGVYEALYKLKNDAGDTEGAVKELDEGRERFPDDTGLLYAEINRALQAGELNTLIEKLKYAIEKDPENLSVYTTLGNVYDRLYQEALEAGDMDKANEHYTNANKYYTDALAIDAKHFDAIYSLGALEYNKAAHFAKEMNALADDYSKEGTKKYDAKKGEMMAQFDKALPYFEEAEQLNPNDLNTLIALKEIFARKDQLDKSNAYKERLEALQAENE